MRPQAVILVLGWSSNGSKFPPLGCDSLPSHCDSSSRPCRWELAPQPCSWGVPAALCSEHGRLIALRSPQRDASSTNIARPYASELGESIVAAAASQFPPAPAALTAPQDPEGPTARLPVDGIRCNMGVDQELLRQPAYPWPHRIAAFAAAVGWAHCLVASSSTGGGCWLHGSGSSGNSTLHVAGGAGGSMHATSAPGRPPSTSAHSASAHTSDRQPQPHQCQQEQQQQLVHDPGEEACGYADASTRDGGTACYPDSGEIAAHQWRSMPLPSDVVVVQVAAGELHYLALDASGSVWAWGANDNGQCGEVADRAGAGGPDARTAAFTRGGFVGPDDASFGARCVLGPAAAGAATGDAEEQQREEKREGPQRLPRMALLVCIRQVCCGARHSLAVDDRGSVWAWGWNGYGQCGVAAPAQGGPASRESITTPLRVQGGALGGVPCRAVAAGLGHSLSLTEAGQVVAWGWNDAGQCGAGEPAGDRAAGSRSFSAEPRLVVVMRQPAVGAAGGCSGRARSPFGSGPDADHEEGVRSKADSSGRKRVRESSGRRSGGNSRCGNGRGLEGSPQPGGGEASEEGCSDSEDEEEIVKISCGGRHSLALAVGGRLYGWGSSSRGQLGRGHTGYSSALPQLLFPPPLQLPPQRSAAHPDSEAHLATTPSQGPICSGRGQGAPHVTYGGATRACYAYVMLGGQIGPQVGPGSEVRGGDVDTEVEGAFEQCCGLAELLDDEQVATALALASLGDLVVEDAEGGWSHTVLRCVSHDGGEG